MTSLRETKSAVHQHRACGDPLRTFLDALPEDLPDEEFIAVARTIVRLVKQAP